jgi:hypothetical protein
VIDQDEMMSYQLYRESSRKGDKKVFGSVAGNDLCDVLSEREGTSELDENSIRKHSRPNHLSA